MNIFRWILLLIPLMLVGFPAYSQSTKAQIKNVDFELVNENIIITYDIIKYKPEERFNVWVDVYTALENKIKAQSLTGDVNDNVSGGNRKKIVWDIKKDSIILNNDIYVVVSAKLLPETKEAKGTDASGASETSEAPATSMGKWLLLSSVYPGWGNYKVHQKKAWWLMGVAAYGLAASSVILNRQAALNYDKYLVSTEIDERNNLYDNAGSQKQLSTVFIAAAGAVWVADITWLMFKGKKKKDVSIGYQYNPATGKPLLSAMINF